MRTLIRSLGVLAAVSGSALLFTAPSLAHAGENGVEFNATASCIDGPTSRLALDIIDTDPAATIWMRVEGYDDQSSWPVAEGEFTASTTAMITTTRTQVGARIYDQDGFTLFDSGLLTGCTGDLGPVQGPDEPPVSVGELSFVTTATCGVEGMTLGVGIVNSGAPTTVTVNRQTTFGGSAIDYNVGDINATLWVPHMEMAKLSVSKDGVQLYDTGWRFSNPNGVCGWAVPALRDDLSFTVDAVCSESYAHVTLTIANLMDDSAIVAYSNGSGSDGDTVHPNGQGTGTYEFDMPIGNSGWVQVNDVWGRFLWASGDIVANAEGCLKPAVEVSSELACKDGVPTLSWSITNNTDSYKTIEWYYGFTGEDYLGNDSTNVPAHSTWAPSFALPHGGLIDASARDLQPAISPQIVSFDAAAIGDCTTADENTPAGEDTPAGGTGGASGSDAPTPTVPTTAAASDPGSLPVTGGSMALTVLAVGLVVTGLGLTVAARRRTA